MKRFVIAITLILAMLCLQSCNIADISELLKPNSNSTESTDIENDAPVNENNELSAEKIYELVSPSVVEITGESRTATSTGTGFFYDNKGTVITNYHVIEKCTEAKITLSNGSSYNVIKVLGYDVDRDIAILSTTCSSSEPLTIRNTPVKTGETVYAIGSSLGLSGSLSDGIISSAEREVNGSSYIQTTAPISHGNSGGPLIDKDGKVIGITSASLDDGQNLNLAIPIAEVKFVSTYSPISLSELFAPTVEWISDWAIQFEEDINKYILFFEIADEEKVPMTCSGTAEIKIVNDKNVTVYNDTKTFTDNDFSYWTSNNGTVEEFLAAIYINANDIQAGNTSEGKIYFTVYGDGYSFEECDLDIYDLPIKPVTVELPNFPISASDYYYGNEKYTSVKLTGATYEIEYGDSLNIYLTGEKTFDCNGNNNDSICSFNWKLYDKEGYLIDSGSVYTDSISVGDKFKETITAFDCIEPGGEYRLVFTDSN